MQSAIARLQRYLATSDLQRCLAIVRHKAWRVQRLSNMVESVVCVDIGAAHFPHPKWWLFLQSPNTHWLAVDPAAESLRYVEQWKWKCSVKALPVEVSAGTGARTLHVTNSPTGSSLLRPRASLRNDYRYTPQDLSYFFPTTDLLLETISLDSVLAQFGQECRFVLKLDIQGSEFEVLTSLASMFDGRQILAVESEVSLLHSPPYENAPRLWDVVSLMEQRGFELLQLDTIEKSVSTRSRSERGIIAEADAVFVLRRELVMNLELTARLQLLCVFVTYRLFDEARSMLCDDQELADFIRNSPKSGRFSI